MDETKGKQKCVICKEDANFLCSSCQSASYCSVAHQKKHWKLHKSSCACFNIKNDPTEFTGAGKYCVASRDLKAGVVILEELPVFQMPSDAVMNRCFCITCGMDLLPKNSKSESNSCHKCKWPVCGTACAKFPLHADNECKVFVANKYEYPNVVANANTSSKGREKYSLIMRAYALMIQNPERLKELFDMLEWGGVESPTDYDISYHDAVIKLTSALPHYPKVYEEDQGLLFGVARKVVTLLSTQGYNIRIQDESSVPGLELSSIRQRIGAYVYPTARHFVHSCSPNCFWTVGMFPDFKIQIRTSVAVNKAEKLTVSRFIYNLDFDSGTRSRQKIFRNHFNLSCRCKLCLDPTEFGTFQSAVVCELCKKKDAADADGNSEVKSGFLLPEDPLNVNDDAPWKCSRCKKITTALELCGKLKELLLDLQSKFMNDLMSGYKACEVFIQKYRNKLVHPNHWLIQYASKLFRCSQILRFDFLNAKQFSEFEKHLVFLVDLSDKIVPGINYKRIVVVSYLSRVMCQRLLAASALDEFQRQSKEDLLDILAETEKCQQYQNESLLFFKHPPNIQRGQIVDNQLSTLRHDKQCLDELKSVIHCRIAEIEIQRLRLGVN